MKLLKEENKTCTSEWTERSINNHSHHVIHGDNKKQKKNKKEEEEEEPNRQHEHVRNLIYKNK